MEIFCIGTTPSRFAKGQNHGKRGTESSQWTVFEQRARPRLPTLVPRRILRIPRLRNWQVAHAILSAQFKFSHLEISLGGRWSESGVENVADYRLRVTAFRGAQPPKYIHSEGGRVALSVARALVHTIDLARRGWVHSHVTSVHTHPIHLDVILSLSQRQSGLLVRVVNISITCLPARLYSCCDR
jgi:hypothetical protein